MNMLKLTEEDVVQLRSNSGVPQDFKACPHWDNRIRFFQKDGRNCVLFCCNRPDFNGDSGPIGEGLQRSQTCVVTWASNELPPDGVVSRTLADRFPTIGYLYLDEWPNPVGHSVFALAYRSVDESWEKVNRWIDNGEFSGFG